MNNVNSNIEPYYKSLILLADEYSISRHPATFIGMHDVGKNYLFNLLIEKKTHKDESVLIPLDFTGAGNNIEKIVNAFFLGFSKYDPHIPTLNNLDDVWRLFSTLSLKINITFVINIHYNGKINLSFWEKFLSWQNILGLKMNWIIFANYAFLNAPEMKTTLFEKLVKSKIIPILPLDYENSLVVFQDYIRYLGQLDQKYQKELFTLSGGNPGLYKSLFLLAQKNNLSNWKIDDQTIMRILKILGELSEKELSMLLKLSVKQTSDVQNELYVKLSTFGYINNKGVLFSPLVTEYLPIYYDESAIELSNTQKQIFSLLKEHSPNVIARDDIAKIMWGNRWNEDYSDWAMDQMIYAVRAGLKRIKSSWTLKTKKNSGYYLIQKNA